MTAPKLLETNAIIVRLVIVFALSFAPAIISLDAIHAQRGASICGFVAFNPQLVNFAERQKQRQALFVQLWWSVSRCKTNKQPPASKRRRFIKKLKRKSTQDRVLDDLNLKRANNNKTFGQIFWTPSFIDEVVTCVMMMVLLSVNVHCPNIYDRFAEFPIMPQQPHHFRRNVSVFIKDLSFDLCFWKTHTKIRNLREASFSPIELLCVEKNSKTLVVVHLCELIVPSISRVWANMGLVQVERNNWRSRSCCCRVVTELDRSKSPKLFPIKSAPNSLKYHVIKRRQVDGRFLTIYDRGYFSGDPQLIVHVYITIITH